MVKFNFKEKSFIIFVILATILNFNTIIASLFSLQVFLYSKFILLYLFLFLVSTILLFINTNKTKKIAWILALISAIIFLFNPSSVPTNPSYMWGSFISFIQSMIWKDFTTALLQLNRSLIPIIVGTCSFIELKNHENKNLDKIMGIILIGLFCFSLFADKIILGIFELNQYIKPVIYSLIFIIAIFLWNKFEK
ncbi:MAG: hypothetical protein KJ583_05010 [Nanoarchaeota archaeon]|nr:hypothetical protein [Nanoarchaeota archaeon]MBU1270324.1 hypothetical protein [Nanoarchaeota archaeon]MBU1604649.1 hypothetical protein [Nanoarchaeota archaeon]MBU2443279.1 hypothetical protein [Nanoarchaeota archaeon]